MTAAITIVIKRLLESGTRLGRRGLTWNLIGEPKHHAKGWPEK